jgi:hypothetical protein
MIHRFVYVARLQTGDEVAVRQVLRQVPESALEEHGVEEFATYVGSGYCVLQFALPEGDFQQQCVAFLNDTRMHEFTEKLSGLLVEGDQIGRTFSPGSMRFHGGGMPAGGDTVTSAELPLTAEVGRWTRNR